MTEQVKPITIRLKNVRLSYPSIFEKGYYQGTQNEKYEATFLLDKQDEETKRIIDKEVRRLLNAKKIDKIKRDNSCVKDGDDEDTGAPETEGCWTIKAKSKHVIPVFIKGISKKVNDKWTSATKEEAEKYIYPGCHVNATISFWIQDNKWGKRVGANMLAIQFLKHGEPFGSSANQDFSEHFDFDEGEIDEDIEETDFLDDEDEL